MKLFSVKLPFDFEIISSFPCDDMFQAETRLHGIFSGDRVHGEWFTLSDEDIDGLKYISYFDESQFFDKHGHALAIENLRYDETKGKPWYTEEEFKQLIQH